VKVAFKVTALFGMLNVHEDPEHAEEEIPEIVDQLLNFQPELGLAVTVSELPTVSLQPLEQDGLTEP
jgi:hypothetical protein